MSQNVIAHPAVVRPARSEAAPRAIDEGTQVDKTWFESTSRPYVAVVIVGGMLMWAVSLALAYVYC